MLICGRLHGTKKKPDALFERRAGKNSRQRPTLPRSFPRSTIGGRGLNFRVRNGNGCDPSPMSTGKGACELATAAGLIVFCLGFPPPPACSTRAPATGPLTGMCTVAPKARRWNRPRQSVKSVAPAGATGAWRRQLSILQTVVSSFHEAHTAECVHLVSRKRDKRLWSSRTAD